MSSNQNTEEQQPLSLRWETLSPSRGRDVGSAAPADPQDDNRVWNFVTFLAVAQAAKFDFLSITWPRATPAIGFGGTARIHESLINYDMSFAFKVVKEDDSTRSADEKKIFRLLISEISVLGHPFVRKHPNIISLLGICWDIFPSGRVWPVLVYEKAHRGDLRKFVKTETGKQMGEKTRIKVAAAVATAVRDLHRNGRPISLSIGVYTLRTQVSFTVI